MSLIIHELTSEEAERHNNVDQKTISFVGPEKGYCTRLVVTVETLEDKPILQQLIDSFVNKYTSLLADYRRFEIPCNRKLFILVWAREHVTIYVQDMQTKRKSTSFSYEVPESARLSLPEVERDGTWLENSN
jgi:hypothetical protein